MRVYLYSRISTDKQELTQQRNKVQGFLDSRGWEIAKEVYDENVSGYKVSYKDRGLAKLLDMMEEGDCLICSELSRLGRKIYDINKLINDDLKPRKLRLVIVSMGIALDCANMKAIDEAIINNFAFAAQVEAEMTSSRTQSSLDAIQKEIDETGHHVAKKSGRVITQLGRPKGCKVSDEAIRASVASKQATARENEHNKRFYRYLMHYEAKNGIVKTADEISALVQDLAALDYRTATGMPFDIIRCRNMIRKVKKLYAS